MFGFELLNTNKIEGLERVQRMSVKLVKGLDDRFNKKHLRELELFRLQ